MRKKLSAIYKITWTNDGLIPKTGLHAVEFVNFARSSPQTSYNSLRPVNLFDFDTESGTLCWGSTASCWLQCKARSGKVFTVWDSDYMFSRDTGLTSSMTDFDFTRCPEVMTLSPGGLLYIISRVSFFCQTQVESFSGKILTW